MDARFAELSEDRLSGLLDDKMQKIRKSKKKSNEFEYPINVFRLYLAAKGDVLASKKRKLLPTHEKLFLLYEELVAS